MRKTRFFFEATSIKGTCCIPFLVEANLLLHFFFVMFVTFLVAPPPKMQPISSVQPMLHWQATHPSQTSDTRFLSRLKDGPTVFPGQQEEVSHNKVPEPEGLVPRTGQGILSVRRHDHVRDEVAVAPETPLRNAIARLILGQLPQDQGLV